MVRADLRADLGIRRGESSPLMVNAPEGDVDVVVDRTRR